MATYPGAVKTYDARSNGQTIDATHVGDLQDEVNAIESALKNGLAHHLLFTDATYDIGQSGATRPRNLFMSGDLVIGSVSATDGAIRLPNAAKITGRNAANSANIQMLHLNSLNQVELAPGGDITSIGGAMQIAADQYLQFAGDASGPKVVGTLSGAVANDGTITPFGAASPVGVFFVHASDQSVAIYFGDGTNTTEIADEASVWTNTVDTGSSYNIYYTGGALTIQNKSGAERTFKTVLIRFAS